MVDNVLSEAIPKQPHKKKASSKDLHHDVVDAIFKALPATAPRGRTVYLHIASAVNNKLGTSVRPSQVANWVYNKQKCPLDGREIVFLKIKKSSLFNVFMSALPVQ